MIIFYKKSNNSFCGAGNIDKSRLKDDEFAYINVENDEWLNFIQTSEDIYIENEKLISKSFPIDFENIKEQKIKEIKDKTAEIIRKRYSQHTQINILNELSNYTNEDKKACKNFINNIILQGLTFQNDVNKITDIENLKNYEYTFIEKE